MLFTRSTPESDAVSEDLGPSRVYEGLSAQPSSSDDRGGQASNATSHNQGAANTAARRLEAKPSKTNKYCVVTDCRAKRFKAGYCAAHQQAARARTEAEGASESVDDASVAAPTNAPVQARKRSGIWSNNGQPQLKLLFCLFSLALTVFWLFCLYGFSIRLGCVGSVCAQLY